MSFSNEDDGKHIVIRLEVKIPHAPTSAPVVINGVPVSSDPAAPQSRGAVTPQFVSTAVPSPTTPAVNPYVAPVSPAVGPSRLLTRGGWLHPVNPANVKVTGSSKMGAVCVMYQDDTDESNGIPEMVVVKIFQMQSGVSDPPLHVPANCSTPENGYYCTVPDVYGMWTFAEVEGASCAPGAFNKVLAWRRFPGNVWQSPLSRTFNGTCAALTDCEDEVLKRRAKLADAPKVWQLQVNGCTGVLSAFNGRWALVEQVSDSAGSIWRQGGDGVSQPQVELVGPRCGCCHPAELRFKLAGVNLAYRCRSEQWNMQGVNRFASIAVAQLPAECELPTSVEVSPG